MMNRKNVIAVAISVFMAMTCIIPVFAIDAYVTVVYRRIDIAFINRSESELDAVLGENNTDHNYYLIENYTMKKIRRLVVDEDYKFALQADLVVIDNNLDNMEAVEMYATISSAIAKQEEQERAIEEKRQFELARFNAEKERHRLSAEKQYSTVQTPNEEVVYVKDKSEKYSATWWNIRFGMFDGIMVTEKDSEYSSVRYAISADINYEHSFDKLMTGIDLSGQFGLLPLTNDDSTMIGDFSIVPKIGFPELSKQFQLRAGFAGVMRLNAGDVTTLHGSIYSPLVGVGFNHVNIGSATLSGNADYYAGHLFYDDINFAMEGGLNLGVPITTMEKVKVSFNFGVKDLLYVKESGVENRASVILAIGAENVFK